MHCGAARRRSQYWGPEGCIFRWRFAHIHVYMGWLSTRDVECGGVVVVYMVPWMEALVTDIVSRCIHTPDWDYIVIGVAS